LSGADYCGAEEIEKDRSGNKITEKSLHYGTQNLIRNGKERSQERDQVDGDTDNNEDSGKSNGTEQKQAIKPVRGGMIVKIYGRFLDRGKGLFLLEDYTGCSIEKNRKRCRSDKKGQCGYRKDQEYSNRGG